MKSTVNHLTNLILFLFFAISLMNLIKTVFFSQNNWKIIKSYRESLKHISVLLVNERQKNEELREFLKRLEANPTLYLETFARDYLFAVPSDGWIILNRNTTCEN